jgi:hypothetical protein
MTLIEIKPHRWGWKVFEAPGVEPVFPPRNGGLKEKTIEVFERVK